MRASRALAVTATACAAVALSAPLAGATNGPRDVSVNPFEVHRGGTLHIRVEGCGHGGTVTSNAFSRVELSVNSSGHSSARARIHDFTTPGHYNLAVRCSDDPRTVTHQFRVLEGRGALGGLGGSVGPSSTEMAVGGGLVAAAAVGGSFFLTRRRRLNAVGV
ncbi:hypothetical protein ACFXP3_38050 [Streptomyces sp. NPDC059096]|uniref:hypothetical protein n=1 Tax=unclassified Streptomyces TaxID=2593676 RepID=UPI0036C5D77B